MVSYKIRGIQMVQLKQAKLMLEIFASHPARMGLQHSREVWLGGKKAAVNLFNRV